MGGTVCGGTVCGLRGGWRAPECGVTPTRRPREDRVSTATVGPGALLQQHDACWQFAVHPCAARALCAAALAWCRHSVPCSPCSRVVLLLCAAPALCCAALCRVQTPGLWTSWEGAQPCTTPRAATTQRSCSCWSRLPAAVGQCTSPTGPTPGPSHWLRCLHNGVDSRPVGACLWHALGSWQCANKPLAVTVLLRTLLRVQHTPF